MADPKKQDQRIPPLPPAFVGREKESLELFDLLKQDNNASIVIKGIGGIGKTAFAATVFNSIGADSDRYWINLHENPHELAEDFRRLSDVLKKRTSKKEFLVVIDGAERVDKDRLLPQILNLQERFGNLKFLITSRQSLDIVNQQTLDLPGLSQQDSLLLLKDAMGGTIDQETQEELHKFLQGHPLALILASSFLKSHSPEELIHLLDWPQIELGRKEPDESGVTQNVGPVIISANDYIIDQLKKSPRDIYKLSPRKFEEVVAELLKGMGWDVKLTQATRDGGMDILAYMITQVGPLLCLVEAKQYREDRPVGVSLVRNLYGTLMHEQANSALLVTTSSFTRDATEFQGEHKYLLGLKDYFDLLDWIGKHEAHS